MFFLVSRFVNRNCALIRMSLYSCVLIKARRRKISHGWELIHKHGRSYVAKSLGSDKPNVKKSADDRKTFVHIGSTNSLYLRTYTVMFPDYFIHNKNCESIGSESIHTELSSISWILYRLNIDWISIPKVPWKIVWWRWTKQTSQSRIWFQKCNLLHTRDG